VLNHDVCNQLATPVPLRGGYIYGGSAGIRCGHLFPLKPLYLLKISSHPLRGGNICETVEALPEGCGAATLYAQALPENTSTICPHGNNENSHMIELERNTTTLRQNFPVTAQFFAETAQFCAAADQFCAVTAQFCAETEQFFAVTDQFCAATAQFCAETDQFFVATAQFCGTTDQFCAATAQFFAVTDQFCAATAQFFAVTDQFCAATAQFYSMTQKNVSKAGDPLPAIEKTFRTYENKGKWAVRMCAYA